MKPKEQNTYTDSPLPNPNRQAISQAAHLLLAWIESTHIAELKRDAQREQSSGKSGHSR